MTIDADNPEVEEDGEITAEDLEIVAGGAIGSGSTCDPKHCLPHYHCTTTFPYQCTHD